MRSLALFTLSTALVAASAAQAQTAKPCITGAEMEGLALVVMPEALRGAGQTCRPHLPANALLNRPQALMAKYQAETAGAWPMALAAMGKIVDPQARELLGSEMGKAMLPAMIGPMIAQEIKPADCGAINRAVELVAPLPARNAAGLLSLVLQLASKKNDTKFPVCRFGQGR